MNIFTLIKKDIKLFFKSKSAVVLTYLVPMVITLIFGAVFGGMGKPSGMNEMRILMVDDDKTEFSELFQTTIDSLPEIAVHTKYTSGDSTILFNLETMDEWIKRGKRGIGIYLPKGFEQRMLSGEKLPLEIHYDPKFSVEYGIITGIIQKVIMSRFPQLMFNSLWKRADDFLGEEKGNYFKSDISHTVSKYFKIPSGAEHDMSSSDFQESDLGLMDSPVEIKSVQLLGEEEENIMFVQYVAGMAVMFLLFSVVHAGSSILEEKNNGTIKRLLIAPVKRREILTGKMLFVGLMGLSQLIVLFIFGWLVFSLNIFKDIPALLVMIVVTALACSSLGVLIAAICRNLSQVNSISTLLILGMSALGGSMFPSFLMPKYIQTIGKFTLNHWAMKGFTDIFWRNLHIKDILPSVGILLGICLVFSYIAIRIFRKRLVD
ncbi:MAG: ABC transporter permease [Candidatus Cloacimonetes bacterium]|nr:ABC transporter permease [Candidatus Cloacimonadota bacterium]